MVFVKGAKTKQEFKLTEKQKEALALLGGNQDIVNYLLIGGSRCMAGDTVLDGNSKTVAELEQQGKPVWVVTPWGYREATSPFSVGRMRAVSLMLSDGKHIKVSLDHGFWTTSGWVRAGDLKQGQAIAVRDYSRHILLDTIRYMPQAASRWLSTAHEIVETAKDSMYRAIAALFGVTEDDIVCRAFAGGRGSIESDVPENEIEDAKAAYEEYRGDIGTGLGPEIMNLLDEPKKGTFAWATVTRVEDIGEEEMYSISVPSGEQFFANGILNHNSGKTFFGVHLLVVRAMKFPESRHIICRLRFAHAKTSIWMDTLPKVLKAMGLVEKRDYKLNRTDYFVHFTNGSELWIDGLDNAERVEKMLGREYNTIYYNEISQLSYDTVTTVQSRLSKRTVSARWGVCRNFALYDCNPPTKRHWSYVLWFKHKDPGDIMYPDLREEQIKQYAYIKMNPSDNLANVGEDYMTLLDNLPERKRKRFRDGEYSDVEGQIYENWTVVDEIPGPVRRVGKETIGVDLGFTVDPSVALDMFFVQKKYPTRSQLWVDELIYETGLQNPPTAEAIFWAHEKRKAERAFYDYKHMGGELTQDEWLTSEYVVDRSPLAAYIDARDPKARSEIQSHWSMKNEPYVALPSSTGQDTIRAGIDYLQNLDIFITRRSVNTIQEIETYEYKKDEEGRPTTDPMETDNHAMDALRYGCTPYIDKKIGVLVGLTAS